MLTRFVRIQLIIFAIVSVIGVFTMVVVYMQAPTLLNIGRMKVTVELPGTGGLYRFSNVTYRGVQIGKVTDVSPTRGGAEATMSLDTSYDIPADVHADVRSVSAVGEQYLDLRPVNPSPDSAGPYLRNGSVIPKENTSIPEAVGPMLDRTSALLDSVPKDRISDLLDESFKGLNGSGFDLGSLIDSGATLVGDANGAAEQMRSLVDDSRPLLDGQQQSIDQIKTWAGSLARITERVADNDAQVRTILREGPGTADEASRMLNQIKPTLPVLLANMTTVGQVAVTYHASIEQLLVLLPPYVAATQTVGVARNNPTGMSMGDFTLSINDPPACTVGFLPPSSWRSPADLSDIDTPDGLYCKLPQDSPIGVRGARNYPCMGVPGKRAPTVEMCQSDKPYEPLAMRPHVLGAYPIDPNLIAQGVAPDDRIDPGANIHGPIEGTLPGPNGPAPSAPSAPVAPPVPADVPTVAPSSHSGGSDGPSVAIATYDRATGQYATPDGAVHRQANLATPAQTWEDLLPK